ncbi:hypothetical protein LMG23992_01012 [Cupriavidus laharis]|uniref:Prenyltransferase alpha-alpha toroid domain-containing protein n=1 Tax=Cupriavidus laharis TaxID=151654 RepID=A0ABM8WL21_9BURK|nr:hypothetical protein [Cupriavidus laharis]CAG9168082.1 hypothetical protein LMG23992_01012 [Cupriavidus laharis]
MKDSRSLAAADFSGVAQAAAAYLASRQSASGGFCFYRTPFLDQPNLADTYCAVRGLMLQGESVPHRQQVLSFLESFDNVTQPSQCYCRALAWRCLEPGWKPDPMTLDSIDALTISPAPLAGTPRLAGWLTRTRAIARLKHAFARFPDAAAVRAQVLSTCFEGAYGVRPNLWDTWLALDILHCCGKERASDATRDFVDRLQVASYGFTGVAGSILLNLDAVFAGVRCCKLLDTPVRYPRQALVYVLACQTGKGGFARAPGALPDMELTYRAVWILCRLQGGWDEEALALRDA